MLAVLSMCAATILHVDFCPTSDPMQDPMHRFICVHRASKQCSRSRHDGCTVNCAHLSYAKPPQVRARPREPSTARLQTALTSVGRCFGTACCCVRLPLPGGGRPPPRVADGPPPAACDVTCAPCSTRLVYLRSQLQPMPSGACGQDPSSHVGLSARAHARTHTPRQPVALAEAVCQCRHRPGDPATSGSRAAEPVAARPEMSLPSICHVPMHAATSVCVRASQRRPAPAPAPYNYVAGRRRCLACGSAGSRAGLAAAGPRLCRTAQHCAVWHRQTTSVCVGHA